jgi:hypothetical protein
VARITNGRLPPSTPGVPSAPAGLLPTGWCVAELAMLCFPKGTAKVAEFFARQAQAAAVQRGSGRAAARTAGI